MKTMTLKDLQNRVLKEMNPEDIASDYTNNDLYIRCNDTSNAIVKDARAAGFWDITKFVDQIDGDLWYDIPFAKID